MNENTISNGKDTYRQGTESFGMNDRLMAKHVLTAVIGNNESKSLLGVKPLDSPL